MGDSFITVIGIFLAAILLLVFPVMVMSEKVDEVAQNEVNTLTAEFVENVRTTGKITMDNYSKFVQELTATGNTYNVEMQVQVLDENPGKKATQTSTTKIGENVYYSVYTSQIMEKLEDPSKGVYPLTEGGIVSVTVRNDNLTLSQQLKDWAYKVVGNDTYTIAASSTGLVLSTGK